MSDCCFGAGSSPLARGTHTNVCRRDTRGRLIPARAGNTVNRHSWRVRRAAHPRSRGEHTTGITGIDCHAGSSPLARGTLEEGGAAIERPRLIPARAGNTNYQSESRRCPTAHPRSRGEHSSFFFASISISGSSPLARGTRKTEEAINYLDRLIPARAGNTREYQCAPSTSAAHPRSRGEHNGVIPGGQPGGGSSPLARGTLARPRRRYRVGRLIPARAGNTTVLRF